MAWVQIERAHESTWDDYRRVAETVGRGPTAKSREAEGRFRETRLMSAVAATLAQGSAEGGPPPDERFEVQAIREP